MTNKLKEIRAEVFGRVQGVSFRKHARKLANNLGLKGSVMNLANGAVLIVAQGLNSNLIKFINQIKNSPGFSKVENVDVCWNDIRIKYKDFKIVKEGNFFVDKWKSITNLFNSLFERRILDNVPEHVAVIPDGNRRWAKHRGLEPHFGHYKSGSFANVEMLIKEAKKLGIKCFSIWGFSTENWKRNNKEKKAIFDLILSGIERFEKLAKKEGIVFKHVGRKDRLPKKLVNILRKLEKESLNNGDFRVELCLDYGGRDEIIRAVNKILMLKVKKINEKTFLEHLDANSEPDLIIRTGGEKRISGFMPFQSTYAELYFTDVYFPEFGINELRNAIAEYERRQRRFGGD